MLEIKVFKGEPIDRALKRLKVKLEREGVMDKIRERRRYEKPSAKRRRKEKKSKFEAMLRARREN